MLIKSAHTLHENHLYKILHFCKTCTVETKLLFRVAIWRGYLRNLLLDLLDAQKALVHLRIAGWQGSSTGCSRGRVLGRPEIIVRQRMPARVAQRRMYMNIYVCTYVCTLYVYIYVESFCMHLINICESK